MAAPLATDKPCPNEPEATRIPGKWSCVAGCPCNLELILRKVDILLGSDDLVRTNLSGHPSMIVRFGSQELASPQVKQEEDEKAKTKPVSMAPRTIKLTAKYFGDAWLVAVADYIERKLPAQPALPITFENR